MSRFKAFALRDGRTYKIFLIDRQPPKLRPHIRFAEFISVEGQWEVLRATLEAGGFEIEEQLGIPLPSDISPEGDLV